MQFDCIVFVKAPTEADNAPVLTSGVQTTQAAAMDAIKKKMQAMKLEKDNALDRAAMCEQQAKDANLRAEKAEEEARQLQKKIQTIENELDQTQEALMQVNAKLEEKEKALQNKQGARKRNAKQAYAAAWRLFSEHTTEYGPLPVVPQRRALFSATDNRQHGGRYSQRGRSALGMMSASGGHTPGRAPARRRGHQHHPRLRGDRPPPQPRPPDNDPSKIVTLDCNTDSVVPYVNSVTESHLVPRTKSDDALSNRNIPEDETSTSNGNDQIESDTRIAGTESHETSDDDFSLQEERSAGDGAEMPLAGSDASDDDPETAELARLRCPSVCTEVLAERENRRRKRCADYPGLAFGSSIFSSDTMMKFSIIKNELQNIKNTALKRPFCTARTLRDVVTASRRQVVLRRGATAIRHSPGLIIKRSFAYGARDRPYDKSHCQRRRRPFSLPAPHSRALPVPVHRGIGARSIYIFASEVSVKSSTGRRINLAKMTTNIQQGTILDVLKKKMRQTKEEMEKYKDECEEYHKRLQVEVMRREECRTSDRVTESDRVTSSAPRPAPAAAPNRFEGAGLAPAERSATQPKTRATP
ncbi:Tropomyosin-2 [Eumeta japonica]|uniref:Tropomyosin-2 n=1 Tax=Eumeta variegata TaxID=151549 RepID=A0A4C1SXB8_EUMVA|nr:Tropomyosin-2 [Eumeta japonica]